jgi:hypothetical protein
VEVGPGHVKSERPSDATGHDLGLEIELDPLVPGAFTAPTVVGREILVLTEEKQVLRHEGPQSAEKLVGKREIPRCPRETDVPVLNVDIVEDPG